MQIPKNKWLQLTCLALVATASCSSSKRDDLKAPRVVTLTPGPDEVGVPTDTDVQVAFDVKIRASSLTAGSFYIRDLTTDIVVESSVGYESESKTATLRPDSPLATSRTYEAVLENSIRSERFGIGLRDGRRTWRFTTSAVAASELESPGREWQVQLMRSALADRAATILDGDDDRGCELEVLLLLAREISEEFVSSLCDGTNSDFATALTLALLDDDDVLELLAALERAGRPWPEVDWTSVPSGWRDPLRERIGDYTTDPASRRPR